MAINRLSDKIISLDAKIEYLTKSARGQLENMWLDNQDLMQLLHISIRTMQKLRSHGILPYSKINGKVYYRASDIKNLLNIHYIIR